MTLETMAYAGTGDVLKIQKMLSIVGEHIDVEEGEGWKVNFFSPSGTWCGQGFFPFLDEKALMSLSTISFLESGLPIMEHYPLKVIRAQCSSQPSE